MLTRRRIARSPEAMTLGVEEEYLIVDQSSGALLPRADHVTSHATVTMGETVSLELNLCQIEVATPVCRTLDEVRGHLRTLRLQLATAAAETGYGVAAAGTHPFSRWQDQQVDLGNDRYRRMVDNYQIVARQQVICGCHVHVGFPDPDLAVATMTRSRPWLPVLLALSANSPYWQGLDTGYASYRLQVWQRWPTCGMPPAMTCRTEFDHLVEQLQAINAIEDPTFLYWYARPSSRYPTLEFRAGDVCLSIDEAVAMAGLVRALAWTSAAEARGSVPLRSPRREVLDAAMWRASRHGLDSTLVSPTGCGVRPAAEVVAELLDHVHDGLEAHGDREEVTDLVAGTMARGNGASRQRTAFARRGSGLDVVNRILEETSPGAIYRT